MTHSSKRSHKPTAGFEEPRGTTKLYLMITVEVHLSPTLKHSLSAMLSHFLVVQPAELLIQNLLFYKFEPRKITHNNIIFFMYIDRVGMEEEDLGKSQC